MPKGRGIYRDEDDEHTTGREAKAEPAAAGSPDGSPGDGSDATPAGTQEPPD